MPVPGDTLEVFARTKLFDGLTIGFGLHLEPKTAVLTAEKVRRYLER